MKNPIEINLETLTEQVNVKGMKKAELAKHYGLPVTQMTKALKDAGLKIRKFHNPSFVLVTGAADADVAKVEEVLEAKDVASETPNPFLDTDTTAEVSTEEVVNATPGIVGETMEGNANLAEGPGDIPIEEKSATWK